MGTPSQTISFFDALADAFGDVASQHVRQMLRHPLSTLDTALKIARYSISTSYLSGAYRE